MGSERILADRTYLIDASGIRKVFSLAESMPGAVDFSIGQPDFDVPELLKKHAIKAISSGQNKYSQTAGDTVLRHKLANSVRREFGWDEPEVLVTSGVSGALTLAFMALVNPGDEVVIPDPYFVIYKHLVNVLGGRCVFVDSYPGFQLSVEGVRASMSGRTKLIVLNSPCNPTGVVYSSEALRAVSKIAAVNGTIILSDEIYNAFCYDDNYPSVGHYYDRVLVLRGFGKSFAMTGWRLGYVAAHKCLAPVIEAMARIQQYTFVCAPTPFQKAAIAALDYDIGDLVKAYRVKRDIVYEGLRNSFELVKPAGAFYAFVKAPYGSAAEFVHKAIANGVLIIPGGVFSERDTHFRISYTTSDDEIRRGIDILRGLV